jgi:broad specificity phosphatase PhoE
MLIVVRHGRTPANAQGLLLGRLDPELDDEGRAQALSIAEWIGPVDRVITSPLLRARQTAEAFRMEPEVDDRWIELDYGEVDGTPVSDVPATVWERLRTDPDWRPPGGESLAELNQRVVAACDDLIDAAASATVVVVTHVSPIKAVVSWSLGGAPGAAWRTRVGQPSITRIAVGPAGPVLHSFNEAPRP